VTEKTFKMSISYKSCSFELSIYQKILKIKYSTILIIRSSC